MDIIQASGFSWRLWRKIKRCGCGDTCQEHCWEWHGTRNQYGYGRTKTRLGGRTYSYIHRAVWAAVHGRAPAHEVCHRCDNPPCCNPAHLVAWSHQANMLDRDAKGRSRPRYPTPRSREIYARLYDGSCETLTSIARELGISQPRVSQIKARGDRDGWERPPVLL